MSREPDPRFRRLAEALGWIPRIIASLGLVAFVVLALFFFAPQIGEQLERIGEGEWQQPLFLLVFFLPFLALPLYLLVRIWRRKTHAEPAEPAAPSPAQESLPPRRRPSTSTFGCLFGAVLFLGVGVAFSLVFLVPLSRVVGALGWDPVPCEILSSRVERHSGGDDATYSVEVVYRYQVDGRSYQGRRYRFLAGASSGYEGKREVVEQLPVGTVTTCWVDPDAPGEAVLDRGLSWEYLFALLPLVFVALGAGGLWMALAGRRRRKRENVAPIEPGAAVEPRSAEEGGMEGWLERLAEREVLPEPPPPGELVLEAELSPLGKVGCLIGAAILWNGIVGIFLWQLWREPEWFLGCFLVPFVLVGLALLAGIPYQILALANPRPRLVLADGRLAPGRSTMLHWSFSGAAGRLRALTIRLEGREKVTYASGDSSSTRTSVLARLLVVDEGQRSLLGRGSARIELPAGAMHSFSGRRNAIEWALVVHGSIARWPDVQEEFPLLVLPEVPG